MLAKDWKAFYAQERDRLGPAGLRRMVARAESRVFDFPFPHGAIIFPHTKLTDSGELIAAAATAVVRAGQPRVLALGVLHSGLAANADLVKRARAGESEAVEILRRVHGPGIPGDQGHWREEFSLDAFIALVQIAAEVLGKKPPQVIERYPFLTGNEPGSLPGIEELHRLIDDGCLLVATTDPIHHGAAYGTPVAERRDPADPATAAFARERIAAQFATFSARNYKKFAELAAAGRSDFCDNGPVLRELLSASKLKITFHELQLVTYAGTLQAESPTWVAAALASIAV